MRAIFATILIASLGACTKPSESTEAKRTPKPPPAESAAIVPVTIAVEVDGTPAPAVNDAKLEATTPDFKDDEHRAWKISTLVPNANRAGETFALTGEQGVTIVLRSPPAPADPVPALMVNRRGELFGTLLDPAQPFPAYHGQGGRLARPGDPTTRIAGVTKIRAYVDADSGSASK